MFQRCVCEGKAEIGKGADNATLPRIKASLRKVFCRMFRIYCHIYYGHFEHVRTLGAEPHLNTLFQSFVAFTEEHGLLVEVETKPLDVLIKKLRQKVTAQQ